MAVNVGQELGGGTGAEEGAGVAAGAEAAVGARAGVEAVAVAVAVAGAGAGNAIIHSYSHVYLTMLFTLHAKCKRIKTSVPSVSQVEGASWQVACGRWQQAAGSRRQLACGKYSKWQLAGGRWQVAVGRHHWRRLPSCWPGSDAAFQSACCQVPSTSCLLPLPPACSPCHQPAPPQRFKWREIWHVE